MLFHDSRGKRSWTITLVFPAWLVLIVKFAISGITYMNMSIAPMDPIGFSTAFIAIMGPFIYREINDKKMDVTNASSNS